MLLDFIIASTAPQITFFINFASVMAGWRATLRRNDIFLKGVIEIIFLVQTWRFAKFDEDDWQWHLHRLLVLCCDWQTMAILVWGCCFIKSNRYAKT